MCTLYYDPKKNEKNKKTTFIPAFLLPANTNGLTDLEAAILFAVSPSSSHPNHILTLRRKHSQTSELAACSWVRVPPKSAESSRTEPSRAEPNKTESIIRKHGSAIGQAHGQAAEKGRRRRVVTLTQRIDTDGREATGAGNRRHQRQQWWW